MAEATVRGSGALAPVGRVLGRISPSLVPVLAVLTAMLLTIPFMILTGGRGDVGRGLSIAGTAYSALIEGSLGIAINDQVSRDNLDQLLSLAANDELSQADLRRLGQDVDAVAAVGLENANRYQEILLALGMFDEETLADLSTGVTDIRRIGVDTLEPMRPLIAELMEADRGEVRAVAEQFAGAESVEVESRAAVEALAPVASSLSDEDLLRYMPIVNEEGIVRLSRLIDTIDQLAAANIDINGAVAGDIAAIATIDLGSQNPSPEQSAGAVVQAITVSQNLQRAGIADPIALASQIQTVREMYAQGVLTDENVSAALQNELDAAIANNTLVRRPGDRLVVGGGSLFGAATSQNESGYYLRLGGSALLFFPERLETMIVRSIPFIIAGLAVALGFKAGVFNIGAEGQLYAGAIFAVWIGYSQVFAGLPLILHVPLMLIAGLIGGFLWGAIPGVLKAYTGAHEVITTIMLNLIAVRLVDWLIKSTEPIILRDPDPAVSIPRTPLIAETARMPRFTDISPWVFVVIGIVILLLAAWSRREEIRKNIRAIIRPIILGVAAAAMCLFLQFINVRGALHIGFLIMLATVWLTDWFLNKTTPGFELRTVGANTDAAKYAGMNVRWNVILALALGGALAGLAGAIEISAVQYTMQPAFFAGVGFDAIAVSLLARSNPRNMPIAGLLWGALLAGAGLMQIRADISIDLVKIIQALIIMFIAADAIIRYLWRVPKSDEKVTNVFAKGWGS